MAKPPRTLAKALAATGAEQLPLLIAAWCEQPAPSLAARIDVISERLAGGRPDLEGKTLGDLHRGCLARIRGGDPADLTIIFAAIVRQQSRNAIAEMKALAKWPVDPRFATWLANVLDAPPYWSTTAFEQLFRLCAKSNDPRLIATCTGSVTKKFRRHGMLIDNTVIELALDVKQAIAARFAKGIPDLELPPDTAKPRPRGGADALLADIYANPDDRELKRVYADVLAEAGDPLGEFIQLQLAGKRGTAKRIAALATRHWKKWLGRLAPLVREADDVRFEDGFPIHIDIDPEANIAPTIGNARWQTVRSLVFNDELSAELVNHPTCRHLRTVAMPTGSLATLVSAKQPYPWTELSLNDVGPDLGTVAAVVPQLQRLAITIPFQGEDPLPALWSTPTGALLRELSIRGIGLGACARGLENAPPTLERCVMPYGSTEREITYTLTPTPEHRFTQVEVRQRLDYYFFRDLDGFPSGIFTSIRLAPIGRPTPSELARAETHFATCLAARPNDEASARRLPGATAAT